MLAAAAAAAAQPSEENALAAAPLEASGAHGNHSERHERWRLRQLADMVLAHSYSGFEAHEALTLAGIAVETCKACAFRWLRGDIATSVSASRPVGARSAPSSFASEVCEAYFGPVARGQHVHHVRHQRQRQGRAGDGALLRLAYASEPDSETAVHLPGFASDRAVRPHEKEVLAQRAPEWTSKADDGVGAAVDQHAIITRAWWKAKQKGFNFKGRGGSPWRAVAVCSATLSARTRYRALASAP